MERRVYLAIIHFGTHGLPRILPTKYPFLETCSLVGLAQPPLRQDFGLQACHRNSREERMWISCEAKKGRLSLHRLVIPSSKLLDIFL